MKIFENENFDEYILPLDKFVFSRGTDCKFPTDETLCRELCERADKALGKEIPQLYAHSYMRFMKPGDGDRKEFETPYFMRRRMLFALMLGEFASGFSGKYEAKMLDIVWLMLEESSWIVPAHNRTCNDESASIASLPHIYGDKKYAFLDLFCGETAGLLGLYYHFFGKRLDSSVADIVNGKLLYLFKKRVFDPYLERDDMWWMGFYGQHVNNWCPWIVSNVLTACALTESNLEMRKKIVAKSLLCLDSFVSIYEPDGGCDEGPGYWGAAGAALFSSLETLYDMSGGKINKYKNPLIYKMFDYIRKVNLADDYYICFADAHATCGADYLMIYRMGEKTGNTALSDFAVSQLISERGKLYPRHLDNDIWSHTIRRLRNYFFPYPEKERKYTPNGAETLENLEVTVLRSENDAHCTYTVAAKGGHNDESHNHNDVGNYNGYLEGKPFIIDIGVATYTKATFDSRRYTLFPINTCDHNLPMINGIGQRTGRDRCADRFKVDEAGKSVRISYAGAYENREDIELCERNIAVSEHGVNVSDKVVLKKDGEVEFRLNLLEKPVSTSESKAIFANGTHISVRGAKLTCIDIPLVDNGLRSDWNCDKLYRLVMTSEKGKNFDVEVNIERE